VELVLDDAANLGDLGSTHSGFGLVDSVHPSPAKVLGQRHL